MTHFVLATTATFIVAMATGVAAVAQNEWFGASDLLPFAIYSTVFALLAAPASVLAYRSTKRLPVWVAAVVAFLVDLPPWIEPVSITRVALARDRPCPLAEA